MSKVYRTIGWAALLAGLSFIGQPVAIGALAPAVFGTTDMVSDPAVLQGVPWFAAVEAGIFLGLAAGMGLLAISIDGLDGRDSVAGRAHFTMGLAATFGWLFVAAASAARYSSVIGTAAPFSDDGRAAFFLAQAMDITTGVFVASLASGLWWIGAAMHRPVARLLGQPLTVFAGLAGTVTFLPNLIGIPWGVLVQIPLFIVVGIVFLTRAARESRALPTTASAQR